MKRAPHSAPPSESDGSICTAVITVVADALGVDPLDLDPQLHDVVDPDALEALFRDRGPDRTGSTGRVTFHLAGCEVVVCSDGRVAARRDQSTATIDGTGEPAGWPATSRPATPSAEGRGGR